MTLKLNWNRLTDINTRLNEDKDFESTDQMNFIIILKDEKVINTSVDLKHFLVFMWKITERKGKEIIGLIVKDPCGIEVFRYKRVNRGNEEIPEGGNCDAVINWNSLSRLEKDVYIKLLISQINGRTE